ncbi:hypothetical protein TBR22_A14750 [Luteitalea sp. TBR-22]|uniref:3-keto-disaccharide hydrolase n=1 Tax=Luteitalea sp. TBR-22 TaxID=2802971 RepID=UPI001AF6C84A|nr:DUF1080 domain-containing protein [Luteitalea sp. TBR-22]BCS32265.1 hypothetical protein TBR22_A14750 [Luteitalea sp. TBR-22]
MRALLILVLALLSQAPSTAPTPSPIQDGEAHGDPPFLLEDGWEPLLDGTSLAGWQACDATAANAWRAVRAIRYDGALAPAALSGLGGNGGVILNGPTGKTANLCTSRTFGDVELYLEFMLPKGSNSGVYLQGLYEMQILDSFGKPEPLTYGDLGGIYHQWIDGKGVGGSGPRVNAARRPGEWQSYQAWFRAPRFDASGRKLQPARFLRVLLNGQLVQTDIDVPGPTRSAIERAESPEGPLMLQGDHGPIAYRNIHVRPLRPLVIR